MFRKIARTHYPPQERPVMVWDGDCSFCRYWITFWRRKTDDRIDYAPYQQVASAFPDIAVKDFRDAVRLIETDGKVYNGADSAYRSLLYLPGDLSFLHRWYHTHSLFNYISDRVYQVVSGNRSFMYKLTVLFFGNNPERLKPYWLLYLGVIGGSLIFHQFKTSCRFCKL